MTVIKTTTTRLLSYSDEPVEDDNNPGISPPDVWDSTVIHYDSCLGYLVYF